MSSGSRIRIGVLTRTYGLGGGIRCALDAEATPSIVAPCDAWTGYSEMFLQPIRLERYEKRPEDLILYFSGIATREDAEKLADRALFLPAEALDYDQPLSHPLLVGYEVRSETGEPLGTITAIFKTPAHFIWSVISDGREWMVPAIDQFVVELNHDDRAAIVRTIPGMVDDGEERDDER